MSVCTIMRAIEYHAGVKPDSIALAGENCQVSYQELFNDLRSSNVDFGLRMAHVVGLAMDNCPCWAMLDLKLASTGLPCVPLPLFFSLGQILHAIRDAGVDCVITDQTEVYVTLLQSAGLEIVSHHPHELYGKKFSVLFLCSDRVSSLPENTAKVTFTSGTTGEPKGVCLDEYSMMQVVLSLYKATKANDQDKHLSMLPLSTLLENIGGLYVSLIAGATCILPSMSSIGLLGACSLNSRKMITALSQYRPTSAILTPELLLGLVTAIECGEAKPESLRFVAVGGASISTHLLQRAQNLGLPVFEGYGLSECASVVAVNTPEACHPGSVGRPLPHIRIQVAEDGEILVSGNVLLGFAGNKPLSPRDFWPTGDIGYLDQNGFLFITGRKKNIFITSFGRNISPEWVERELVLHPAIAQVAVFGESRPFNVAVIVLMPGQEPIQIQMQEAIAQTNALLPDYARISRWVIADMPFTYKNGLATSNGRLRREEIFKCYQNDIQSLYEGTCHAVL